MTARDIADALRVRVTGRVEVDAPLAPLTTFRVGGPADVIIEAESEDDLRAVADLHGDMPIAIVGRGSNLLVSDDGFRGIAVRLGRSFRDHERTDRGLQLGGAVQLPAAARLTSRYGLTGFEFAAEIPATFGGAVRMNAGAHGRCIADVLSWASAIDLATGESRTLDVDDFGYAYRHSELRPMDVVTRGEIVLEDDDGKEVGRRIAAFLRWRRENQPPGRSAGSVFKNPPDDSAGRLLDAAGMKGARAGGAEVSEVHANFIVANPDATASDVWTLIGRMRSAVREKAGVDLEPEVLFLGAFPEVEG